MIGRHTDYCGGAQGEEVGCSIITAYINAAIDDVRCRKMECDVSLVAAGYVAFDGHVRHGERRRGGVLNDDVKAAHGSIAGIVGRGAVYGRCADGECAARSRTTA